MAQVNRLNDIALLRCLATVSLVIWHTYCSYVCWNLTDTPMDRLYRIFFTTLIPDANMPMFTILAGYLFHYLLVEKRKYQKFKEYFVNKLNRLFVPFVVLGLFFNVLQYGRSVKEIFYGQPNHLWYCLMLFYVYIAFWVIEKYLGSGINAMFAFVSIIIVTYTGVGALTHRVVGGLFLLVYYYGYFYIGFILRKYKDLFLTHGYISLFIASTMFFLLTLMHNHHFIAMVSVAYFVVLYVLSNTQKVQIAIGGGAKLMK